MLAYRPLNTQATSRFVLACFLAVAVSCGYTWLVVRDPQRGPRPGRWTTLRAVWRRAILRIRELEPGPATERTVSLAAFDWLLPTLIGGAGNGSLTPLE